MDRSHQTPDHDDRRRASNQLSAILDPVPTVNRGAMQTVPRGTVLNGGQMVPSPG